ncbi:MAG: hypothetical protein HN736_10510 [Anaerolineae bacterium]|jgi:hypothetical protein|nr:hypothetical protein [Anaerolineae bacterium]MBT3713748.1 hypothetical protein [Anaerolineae bacterium]MBT4311438.1 hypothetical protein [Anaerolineae bacterium]MBT4459165.1 hypothetical protein [Anaerolineae bacterium]MBT4841470.1 hypothetical protein [Anaerolineae bacterium]
MSKKILLMVILIATLLTACGGNSESPPLVYLVSNEELIDGFQSSYCWDSAGSTLCVDTIETYFDETTYLLASAPIRFQLDTPLPDNVTISISEELFGETILSEEMPVSDFIDWSPTVAPGTYIIDVHTSWKQGDVSYWFSIVLE